MEDEKRRVTAVFDEFACISGMVQEVIMKAKLLRERIHSGEVDEDMRQEVLGLVAKYREDLYRYEGRLNELNQEITQIYGSS